MELLYMDRTEGLSNQNFGGNMIAYGVLGIASTSQSVTSYYAVSSGLVSNKAIRIVSGSTVNLTLTLAGHSETSGKFVFGAAVHAESVTGTREVYIFSIAINDTHEILTVNSVTGVVTFMGETSQRNIDITAVNYFEVVADIENDLIEVYVNNLEFITKSTTVISVSTALRMHRYSQPALSGFSTFFDDIYILGGTTGPYTNRLGPVRAVRAPLLTATEADFAPVGAATNLDAVNKTDLNTESYNQSPPADDQRDMYKLDLSLMPDDKDIIAVQHQLYYQKTDVGPRRLQAVAKLDSNEETEILVDRVGVYGTDDPMIVTEKPGGGQWDYETLEDAEFGYEVIEHE